MLSLSFEKAVTPLCDDDDTFKRFQAANHALAHLRSQESKPTDRVSRALDEAAYWYEFEKSRTLGDLNRRSRAAYFKYHAKQNSDAPEREKFADTIALIKPNPTAERLFQKYLSTAEAYTRRHINETPSVRRALESLRANLRF